MKSRVLILVLALGAVLAAQPPPDVTRLPRYQDDIVEGVQSDRPAGTVKATSVSEVDSMDLQHATSLGWTGVLPDLSAADRYALDAPASAGTSVENLAAYVKGAGPDRISRLRALYTWEAGNIIYDLDYKAHGMPSEVLKNRRAVCDGYARLYTSVAREMGMEVEHVLGWSRNLQLMQLEDSSAPNHRWVRVRLEDERWGLIDPTWARNAAPGSTVWKLEPRYFLMRPQEFLKNHWPRDSKWQMLAPPLSRKGWGFVVRKAPL